MIFEELDFYLLFYFRYEEQKQRLMATNIRNIIYLLEGDFQTDLQLSQSLITTHVQNG